LRYQTFVVSEIYAPSLYVNIQYRFILLNRPISDKANKSLKNFISFSDAKETEKSEENTIYLFDFEPNIRDIQESI
jgi:hypothetical protein